MNDLRLFALMNYAPSKIALFHLEMLVSTTCLHVQHIWRANHQVGIWKWAHIPEPTIPKASKGHGWEEIEDGYMDPLWCDGGVLPRELLDIAQDISQSIDEDHPSDAVLKMICWMTMSIRQKVKLRVTMRE